ncbi:MAG: 2-methylcitrate dehydratase [Candidatus Brocadia sp.]|jgi:2-methylcitrate dehydratase|uniref:2-methylcitrate dehydratase n=1 Tax=Candidatus Brocadia fulgida TaxID=380242 RepID=A0A0M2UZF1_9BACT|nr:MAG: 2-methylcitrate dehydratase [Candidatus Brocadia fulgida]MCC6325863.1 MmgE/PrpD family protein [Candidatus Brocadia sp.]MCE7910390.1 MmgE/PrpD family protein [Candidatus Brocadia sp. AMX3]OQZ02598.1 MAG: 2-methylcitrate dehydratase [Candidatus Brocadia sp. UTAMX2]MBV6517894.1 2-methylcitrate dehydratase [Candidatus Brocadia fulgida]
MTQAEQLAAFVVQASYGDLSKSVCQQLKIRVLDALGCAIGAMDGEPILLIRSQNEDFGGTSRCTMIGGGQGAPDRTAFYHSALVRYLDFNDSYLAKGETCHPSDNLGAILAAAEYAHQKGQVFMTALAVSYQVHCRLSDVAPLRAKGFDHTTQGAYAVAAGVSKALGMDQTKTAHAIALCGTAFNALRVTRTGKLSHWKGLAYPHTAFGCTHATFLAMRGITGPLGVFEGNKGFMDTISGRFEIDWSRENLERVNQTIIKRYNAEIHSQTAIEGILELKEEYGFSAAEVARIEIDIFDVAYHIIGGGEEGDKTLVSSKEEADHSLPYMIAVAVLDDRVMPDQYLLERIQNNDVQALLRKVTVRPSEAYSRQFPDQMPCRITVSLLNGRLMVKEKQDYEGFHTRPIRWETVVQKFERLSSPYTDAPLRREIIDAVANLDSIQIAYLMRLLAKVQVSMA